MARWFTAGVLVGMVLTTVAGAAIGSHAAAEGGPDQAQDTPADEDAPVAAPEPPPGIWDQLAACESSGDWHNARNPTYKGGLQMDSTFWARYGGLAYAPAPHLASRGQQIAVAIRGQAVQGWQAWPVCSRVIGVR
jgi:resuscitation-promoting factor RpfB